MNIIYLINKAKINIKNLKLSNSTINDYYIMGFNYLLKMHLKHNLSIYSPNLVKELIDKAYLDYQNSIITYKRYLLLRKSGFIIEQLVNNNELRWGRLKNNNLFSKIDSHDNVLGMFLTYLVNEKKIKRKTGELIIYKIHQLIKIIHSLKQDDLAQLNSDIINTSTSLLLQKNPNSQKLILYYLRMFLVFLYDKGITKSDLSKCLPIKVAVPKKIIEGCSDFVINSILKIIDKSSKLGKRNYAIITLISQTCLRACDIANLKLMDIDWKNNSINIIQQKTEKHLIIALPTESGNALADYILNSRPNSDEKYIFLSENPPRKIKYYSMMFFLKQYV